MISDLYCFVLLCHFVSCFHMFSLWIQIFNVKLCRDAVQVCIISFYIKVTHLAKFEKPSLFKMITQDIPMVMENSGIQLIHFNANQILQSFLCRHIQITLLSITYWISIIKQRTSEISDESESLWLASLTTFGWSLLKIHQNGSLRPRDPGARSQWIYDLSHNSPSHQSWAV